jgi:hypothetical protein
MMPIAATTALGHQSQTIRRGDIVQRQWKRCSFATCGTNTKAVTVDAGGSDYYNVVNNAWRTGTHKTLSGNN